MDLNKKEPMPKPNEEKAVWDLVIQDIKERDKIGQQKYKTRLQPFNGRNAAKDAFQEVLDLVVYLRQFVEEREEMVKVLKHYAQESEGSNRARDLLAKLGEL